MACLIIFIPLNNLHLKSELWKSNATNYLWRGLLMESGESQHGGHIGPPLKFEGLNLEIPYEIMGPTDMCPVMKKRSYLPAWVSAILALISCTVPKTTSLKAF